MTKVFIDGREGTTGLRIVERLSKRNDLEIISIPDALRKDNEAKKACFSQSDVVFLCLPDAAAIESAALAAEFPVKIIDASTAHRTDPDWAYGFPELGEDFRKKIENGKNIAVPGCHAGGFIALVYPLVKMNILPSDADLSATSLTGYSGGGKKMIAEYQNEDRSPLLSAPRHYGVGQTHKHLREMQFIPRLKKPPVFMPIVCDYYSGMTVSVPLFSEALNGKITLSDLREVYSEFYKDATLVTVSKENEESFLSAAYYTGRDSMKIFVNGNDDRMTVNAVFDNLGKGASGAAIQCMNIALNLNETIGLNY